MRRALKVLGVLTILLGLATIAAACPPVAPAQAFGGYGAPVAMVDPGLGAGYAGYGGGFAAPAVVAPAYGVAPVGGGFHLNVGVASPAYGVGVAAPLYGSGFGFSGAGFGAPLLASRGGAVVIHRPGLFGRIRASRRAFFRGFLAPIPPLT